MASPLLRLRWPRSAVRRIERPRPMLALPSTWRPCAMRRLWRRSKSCTRVWPWPSSAWGRGALSPRPAAGAAAPLPPQRAVRRGRSALQLLRPLGGGARGRAAAPDATRDVSARRARGRATPGVGRSLTPTRQGSSAGPMRVRRAVQACAGPYARQRAVAGLRRGGSPQPPVLGVPARDVLGWVPVPVPAHTLHVHADVVQGLVALAPHEFRVLGRRPSVGAGSLGPSSPRWRSRVTSTPMRTSWR